MHFSDVSPMDLPAPRTVDEAVAEFGARTVGFVRQPTLSEFGVGTVGSSSNGGPTTLDSLALSYTVWRNPADRDDPRNLAELSDETQAALDVAPVAPLPEWMLDLRRLMRYPTLWEAVLTVRAGVPGSSPEAVLVNHLNHVVTNVFREERVVGAFPGVLDSPATARSIEHVPVNVDGAPVPGLRIDTDPHVFAVGADLGDRVFAAVVVREHLPFVTLEFETRRAAA